MSIMAATDDARDCDISLSLTVDVQEEVIEYENESYDCDDDHDYDSQPRASTSTGDYGRAASSFTRVGKQQSKIDTFAVKRSSLDDSHHLPKNITASDRAKMYPGQLHESGGMLFCTVCNIVIDHLRIFAIKQHMLTKKHLSRASTLGRSDDQSNVDRNQVVTVMSPGPATPPASKISSAHEPARKKVCVQPCEDEPISTKSTNKETPKSLKQQTIAGFKKQTEVAMVRYQVR